MAVEARQEIAERQRDGTTRRRCSPTGSSAKAEVVSRIYGAAYTKTLGVRGCCLGL